ncbi:uncharacterized protein LOC131856734 [Cryptomeria japonica]|uniref:uncharacterized protein LOC131856734 n=1 Tax=Cryptomeria japonica TaxID=3369 RepID=UPI0027DA71C6|nr:uncharacterized protein LOC131856734 [Cryptomeria japonica]
MVKENIDYDLAKSLRSQLMENLEAVKKEKKMRFKFGQLIIGLFFYFQNFFPSIGDVQWITAKKVKKEVEAFAEQDGFTKEQIAATRAKHEVEQGGNSSIPTSTSIGKIRVMKETEKKKVEETKVKPFESQRDKPCKIQFQRKGKPVEPPAMPTQTGKRKKLKAHKLINNEEATELEEDKITLRESAKKPKTTIIPDDEDDTGDKISNTDDKVDVLDGVQVNIGKHDIDMEIEEEKTEKEEKTDKKDEEEKKIEEKETLFQISNKKIIIDDDDDDLVSINGPIDMDNLSSSQLMKIAQAMQSRAQKKRLKEQQKEAKTMRTTIEILSSLLPEIDLENLVTPMDKLGQLVVDVGEQLKTFEEATYISVEKDYKKKHAK